MVVVPLQTNAVQNPGKAAKNPGGAPRATESDSSYWIRYAAAGTLAAGGALLVSGRRRAGLVVALSGAVLAMIDQQETVGAWWNAVPGYLEEVEGMLCRAHDAITDLQEQGEKLRRVLSK